MQFGREASCMCLTEPSRGSLEAQSLLLCNPDASLDTYKVI